jgi:sec-independent protein translocase protein TatA
LLNSRPKLERPRAFAAFFFWRFTILARGLTISKGSKKFMKPIFALLGLSGTELIIVLVAILVLFGAKKIPEFAKGLGKGINEFKKASREVTDSIENDPASAPKTPSANTGVQSQSNPQPPETKVL